MKTPTPAWKRGRVDSASEDDITAVDVLLDDLTDPPHVENASAARVTSVAPVAAEVPAAPSNAPSRRALAYAISCAAAMGVLVGAAMSMDRLRKPATYVAPAAAAYVAAPSVIGDAMPAAVPAATSVPAAITLAPVLVEGTVRHVTPHAPAAGPVTRGDVAPAAYAGALATQVSATPPAAPSIAAMGSPEAFNASRAAVTIAAAARGADACLGPDEAGGTMSVSVTFAPSGRATRATVESGPLLGTPAGSCIARALRAANVRPFDGEPVSVRTSIRVASVSRP